MIYRYRYPTINGSQKRLNTVTPTVSPTVTPAVTHTMTPPVPSRARHAQYTRGIAMPAAGPDPPPAQHAARLVICTICTGACRRVMLGSAGTFTLSRQREFTQREFHTARVSHSASFTQRGHSCTLHHCAADRARRHRHEPGRRHRRSHQAQPPPRPENVRPRRRRYRRRYLVMSAASGSAGCRRSCCRRSIHEAGRHGQTGDKRATNGRQRSRSARCFRVCVRVGWFVSCGCVGV